MPPKTDINHQVAPGTAPEASVASRQSLAPEESYVRYFAIAGQTLISKLVEDLSLDNETLERALDRKLEELKKAGDHHGAHELHERAEHAKQTLHALAAASIAVSGVALATSVSRYLSSTSEDRLYGFMSDVATPVATSSGSTMAALATIGTINPIFSPIGIGIAAAFKAGQTIADYQRLNRDAEDEMTTCLYDLQHVEEEIEWLNAQLIDVAEQLKDEADSQALLTQQKQLHAKLEHQKLIQNCIEVAMDKLAEETNAKRMELIGEAATELFVATAGLSSGLMFAYAASAGTTPGAVIAMAGVLTSPVGLGIIGALAVDYLLNSAHKIHESLNKLFEMSQRNWNHASQPYKTLGGVGMVLTTTVQVVLSPVTLLSHFYANPVTSLKQMLSTMPSDADFAQCEDNWSKAAWYGEAAIKGLMIGIGILVSAGLAVGKFAIGIIKTAVNLVGALVASGSIAFSEGTWDQKLSAMGAVFKDALSTITNNPIGAGLWAVFSDTPKTACNLDWIGRFKARFTAAYGKHNHDDAANMDRNVEATSVGNLINDSLKSAQAPRHYGGETIQIINDDKRHIGKYAYAQAHWERSMTEYLEAKSDVALNDSIKKSLAALIDEIMCSKAHNPTEKLKFMQALEYNRPLPTELVRGFPALNDVNTRQQLYRTWVTKSRLVKVFNQCKYKLLHDAGADGLKTLITGKLASLPVGEYSDKSEALKQAVDILEQVKSNQLTARQLGAAIDDVSELLTHAELDVTTHAVSETKQLLYYTRGRLLLELNKHLRPEDAPPADDHPADDHPADDDRAEVSAQPEKAEKGGPSQQQAGQQATLHAHAPEEHPSAVSSLVCHQSQHSLVQDHRRQEEKAAKAMRHGEDEEEGRGEEEGCREDDEQGERETDSRSEHHHLKRH